MYVLESTLELSKPRWEAAKIPNAPIKASCRRESEDEDIREQLVSPFSTIACKEAESNARRG